MFRRVSPPFLLALAISLVTAGCRPPIQNKSEFQMGEKVNAGPIIYNVVEKVWKSQLGDGAEARIPQNRFLLINISATNSSGSEVSVPLLQLEGSDGKVYPELENGTGVDGWFGVLRTIEPAQTQQGRLLFDVPLGSYRLKLSDGDSESARSYYVRIPLEIDPDIPVEAPPIGRQ